MKKLILASAFLAASLGLYACAHGRVIQHVAGCDERLENPEKKMACRACIERAEPHEFLPDNPEGERCVRR